MNGTLTSVVAIGGNLERAYEQLRKAGTLRTTVFRNGQPYRDDADSATDFGRLVFPGESMLVVVVDDTRVPEIVGALRLSGQAAIFTIAGDLDSNAVKNQTRTIQQHLSQTEDRLLEVHRELREAATLGHAISPAALWLLENTHSLDVQIVGIRDSLSRHLLKNVSLDPATGLPKVLNLAERIVRDPSSPLTQERIRSAIAEHQTNSILTINELWLLPSLIRLALVDLLTTHGEAVTLTQQLREAGYFWANRLAAAARQDADTFARTLDQFSQESTADRTAFLTCVAEQLQDEERALGPLQTWVEKTIGVSLAVLVREQLRQDAHEGVVVANAFNSLRSLPGIDFVTVFEETSLVERELSGDPSGIYSMSDAETRDHARRCVQTLATRSGKHELEVAQAAVRMAQSAVSNGASAGETHVLHYLLGDGVRELERQVQAHIPLGIWLKRVVRGHATGAYLFAIAGLTLAFSFLCLGIALELDVDKGWVLGVLWLLTLFPLSELATQIVNVLVISLFPSNPLPRLALKRGIPPEHTTLVVVPMMLTSLEVARQELEKLEVRYLANPEPNLYFSLFSDFLDSTEPESPSDECLLLALESGIRDLNSRYPNEPFLLFHRHRSWSESEQLWIGHERKRGKLEELNHFLRGVETAPSILRVGRLKAPIRYVITLDADTLLPPLSARRMIATLAHPLNRPVLDPNTLVCIKGHSIIQPRVSISLPGATATRFTRIMGDPHGTDPYCRTVSDAQQDLFGEGIFHGKAIYDLKAFSTALDQRFPAESILSHDLIEGSYAGVGLATDIELFENMPVDYASFTRRQHRWIRGDWQIAAWCLPWAPTPSGWKANPLSAIARWRIFDNLRRSLVPVASVLFLLLGWFLSVTPGVWTWILALALAIPALAKAFDRVAAWVQGSIVRTKGAYDELVRSAVALVVLPHQAWLSLDAILRVWYRSLISRRHLLEWQTAEGTGLEAAFHMSKSMRQLAVISAISFVVVIWQIAIGHYAALPLLLLWSSSPFLVRWLSARGSGRPMPALDAGKESDLRELARQTWRFFDDLVGPKTNWLPPDNTQVAIRVEVANRTSPTNIGLWLTSALAAHDFGFITAGDVCRRCAHTLDTLEKMETYEGHLFNWYENTSLEPLPPRYLSTVDSGNLIACLWVLAQGCREMSNGPAVPLECWRGIATTFANLQRTVRNDAIATLELRAFRRFLRAKPDLSDLGFRLRYASNLAAQIRSNLDGASTESRYWADKLCQETANWTAAANELLGWVEVLNRAEDSDLRRLGSGAADLRKAILAADFSLSDLATGKSPELQELLSKRQAAASDTRLKLWFDDLSSELERCRANAARIVDACSQVETRSRRFAAGINMRFLYDERRKLFGIGYAIGSPMTFSSHYDLLASECRIASLVSIAKSDVPLEHWFTLQRPRTPSPGGQTLLSWSGTMFEYLMPLLFARNFPNSLLEHACKMAVSRQIAYGDDLGIPWGISECAYSAVDGDGTYQYHAFGVPELSLRGLDRDEPVVAPYATTLALQVDPESASDNIERLRLLGLSGPMGLYEAIDFGRQHSPSGDRGVVIYTYMAHHQGMTLLAIDNVLNAEPMQNRFHSDLRVRAIESVLFERVPLSPADRSRRPGPSPVPKAVPLHEHPPERVLTEKTALPRLQLLGNGRYSLMISNSGSGYSRWRGFDIGRWRADSASEEWGSFVFLRDVKQDLIWSATHQPLGGDQGSFNAHFNADRVEFHRQCAGIDSNLQIAVAADHDVEIRRVAIINRTLRTRTLDVTSFLELALAQHAADKAHPAFSKMFVTTEYLGDGVLVATRRKRSPDDPPIWVAHCLVGHEGAAMPGGSQVSFETDREKFLGRGNSIVNAAAHDSPLGNTAGAVIDPAFSLRCRLTLEPRERTELAFLTMAASSREELLELIASYRTIESLKSAFELVWNRAQLEFRYLRIGQPEGHTFQRLASAILYPDPHLRAPAERMLRNTLGQSSLWPAAISGDQPILAITAGDRRALPLVREALLAHRYLRMRGFQFDLVILNQEDASYDRPLSQELRSLVEAFSSETGTDRPGGVFLRDWHSMQPETANLILAASHVVLRGERGSLNQQLAVASPDELTVPLHRVDRATPEEPSPPLPFLELPYFNGLGGFTKDGREYAIYLKPGSNTPAPWSNVIAHTGFGTLVTESGLGFTWSGNSQSNRLTPWHNDPVSDPQSEAIFIRDEETGVFWSPTASPIREQDAYRARHGQGYTVFEHNSHAIAQELTVFVPFGRDGRGENVKVCRLKLRNHSSHARKLSVTYMAELVLGTHREDQQTRISTRFDTVSKAVIAQQWWSGSRQGNPAFLTSSPPPASYTGARTSFIGRNRSFRQPEAMLRAKLDGRTGSGFDPAAAVQTEITLPVGGEAEVVFLFGQCETVDQCRELISRFRNPANVDNALSQTRSWWDSLLGTIQVHTPVLSTDLLLNRWLLYQSASCRIWGRSALYQSGGAIGFRDQLQDSLAFVYALPHLTRKQILTAAARQFEEGDVQHWWHPDTGLGVRTKCSDDLLWLPYAVARYVDATADTAVLEEEVGFLSGPELGPDEHERMSAPIESNQVGTILEHCLLAIRRANQLGPHGIPLIGNGDWNDGMNHVGPQGKGESVWLAWFFCAVCRDFAELLESTGDTRNAAQLRAQAGAVAGSTENAAWDGDWYLRAYFDTGEPLGSKRNSEAKIDSLAQSWSVISGAARPDRARRAIESASSILADSANKLVRLFTPPFDHSEPHPGYIMGYPPGMRENGGQYTHGSLWLAMAWARSGDGDEAVRLLTLMNPVEQSRTESDMLRYCGEPYVVAADVSSAANRMGRSGWTWYTGSAAWMYRIWIEEILGVRVRSGVLTLQPVLPGTWPGFEFSIRVGATLYEVQVRRESTVTAIRVEGDFTPSGAGISLLDDGRQHKLIVLVPKTSPASTAVARRAETTIAS